MIVDLLHARDVLRTDNGRLPRPFIGDDAAEMDDTVAYHDIETERTPIVLLQRIENATTDVVVVGSRIGNLTGEARDRLQQIRARNESDELFTAQHRQSLDSIFLHQGDDFLERRILGDGQRIPGHDFGYPAAVFLNKIGRRLAGAENESEPSAALALRADFAAAEEITFRDDTDELASLVNHRKAADMRSQQDIGSLKDGSLRCDGYDGSGHDLMGAHG